MECLTVVIMIIIATLYILIGGAIFYVLEKDNESSTKETTHDYYNNFTSSFPCISEPELQNFVRKILSAYDQGILAINTSSSASQWNYLNSVFFAMTCVTTIGYGNQSPSTEGGRAFFIFYAIIGIPISGVALAGLGEKMSILVKRLQKNVLIKKNLKLDKLLKSIFVTVSGFVVLVFVPSGIFSAIEGWTYKESIYYCVVSLTTVGFGDFVVGVQDKDYHPMYRCMVILWLLFGLAWVALAISESSQHYKAYTEKMDTKIKSVKDTKHCAAQELKDINVDVTNL